MDTESKREKAVAFFYEHAGYARLTGQETAEQACTRNAEMLADAEAWAKEQDVEFIWAYDGDGDHSYLDQPGFAGYRISSCESVTMTLRGHVVNALGCVDDADDDYRRVVEAELASEARSGDDREAITAYVDVEPPHVFGRVRAGGAVVSAWFEDGALCVAVQEGDQPNIRVYAGEHDNNPTIRRNGVWI